ncbi:MAG: glutamine-synthetase adenylyltransferase [Rubellimicrobium sp.]|nr:glutamine-synthetase adenylyltransferase [Rubellimicrobium sp.]
MDLAARMTRCPAPFDPARGDEVCAALRRLGPVAPQMADLLRGAAGSSPHLALLCEREGAWLLPALADPEAAAQATIAALLPADPADPALGPDLPRRLREGRRRIALLVALADLGGVWPLEEVTAVLTRLADAAVGGALLTLVAAEIARGRLPGQGPDDIATAAGMAVMAMGKMGAHELNYSSDIDLICLFDDSRYGRDDLPEARAAFIRVTRRLTAWLSDVTPEGFVFRTDLRLRPDAGVTPVCLSMSAAESYYEAEGRTWERAAWIKARAAAGDLAAGGRFIATLAPFVWRRHLDFAAIEDAHAMRLRIRDHRGTRGPGDLAGFDLKLGRGGIREIEFFTQTRQLIAGGRDPGLRARGTVAALGALSAAGWVRPEVAQVLGRHYRAHRDLEHRIQMVHDAQTHELPASDEGMARIACLMDTDPATLRRETLARIEEVHSLTEGFFAPGTPADPGPGWDSGDFGAEVTARWPHYPALRSARARAIFRRLGPAILARLRQAARPDEALAEFDAFLAGLPAGVQLFALFDANPQLTHLIVDICATAPALARHLARNAAVLDAVIGGGFFAPWPGQDDLGRDLARALGAVADYEGRLDAARRWMKEWHFRIGVHHLRGLIAAEEAGRQYADLAGAVLATLWPEVVAQFARRHGPPPGRGAAVIAMGSLGAGRLTATSDLDLIVIYDAGGEAQSGGPRPLPAGSYYARLTQALVTALSAPTAEGRLYAVDMRLRPSGRQGPVATALAAFRAYQETEAWTWEHLALTRARPVAGEAALGAEVEAFRRALIRGGDGAGQAARAARIRADVARMRARLAEHLPHGLPALEPRAGRGRLMEIELAAQTAALLAGSAARDPPGQIAAGVANGLLDAAAGRALTEGAALFWRLQAAARLLAGGGDDAGAADPAALGTGGLAVLLRGTGAGDAARLEERIDAVAAAAGDAFDRLAGPPPAGEAADDSHSTRPA